MTLLWPVENLNSAVEGVYGYYNSNYDRLQLQLTFGHVSNKVKRQCTVMS